MKETIVVLAIILALLISYIIYQQIRLPKTIQKEKDQACNELFSMMLAGGYSKRVEDFKVYNTKVNPGGIVFVGDSLTENYNVYEFFKGYNVYNRGIGGDTTIGLLNRMKESIYDLNPSIVVLLIGINDFQLVENSSIDTIYENIIKIIKLINLNCPNCKIILQSLYPISKKEDPKIDKLSVGIKNNKDILKLNEKLKTIDKINYLDVNSHLQDEDGNFKIEYTMEGLHANTAGYNVITALIKKELSKFGDY